MAVPTQLSDAIQRVNNAADAVAKRPHVQFALGFIKGAIEGGVSIHGLSFDWDDIAGMTAQECDNAANEIESAADEATWP